MARKPSKSSITRRPSTTRKNRTARKPSKSSITRSLAQLEILVELGKRTGLIRQMLVGWQTYHLVCSNFCHVFSMNFNTKRALAVHQSSTLPQKVDSRGSLF